MKEVLGLLLMLAGLSAQAAEEKVYLLASAGVNDTTLAHSIFLHEPDITDLESCREAVRQAQRDGDWMKYHHILRKDKVRGFSVQMQYLCVTSAHDIEPWFDRAHYNHAYLIRVDEQARLSVQAMESMAVCMGRYRVLPADVQVRSHCAKGSQQVR